MYCISLGMVIRSHHHTRTYTRSDMLIVGGSDRHKIEYSKGIRSLQSRIEAQALLGLSVCVGGLRSLEQIHQSPKGFNQ